MAPAGAVGGIFVDGPSGTTKPTLQSIVSSILYSDGTLGDVGINPALGATLPVNASNSLIGVVCQLCGVFGTGNIIGQDPRLAWLEYNGTKGLTRTFGLLPGSPAIGTGSNLPTLGIKYDQRGDPFLRTVNGKTDMGAFQDPVSPNLQGVHWGTPPGDYNGEGFFLNQQGTQGESVFGAGYIYASNNPLWLVFAGMRASDGTFSGDAYTATGPSFDKFNASTAGQVTPIKAGTFLLKPGDSGDSRLTFNLNYTLPQETRPGGPQAKAVLNVTKTLELTRQTFGYPIPTCGPATPAQQVAATNYQDIWWASPPGSESGWGLTIAQQGDTLFVAWFTYGPDGHALWLVFAATKTAPNTYSGNVYTATGPSFDAAVYDPSTVVGTQVGTATLTFSDGANGTFQYTVNGVTQSKAITRQVFGSVGNVCQ